MTKNDIIHDYIDKHLLKGICVRESIHKSWAKDNSTVLVYSNPYGMDTLYVKIKIWDELSYMFSLTREETNDSIKSWAIRNNLGISKHTTIGCGLF
jgi:hypothetical protein